MSSATTSAQENDIILQKNERTPFYGVLVSEPRYRAYSEQAALAEFYQKNRDNLVDITVANKDDFYWASGGVVLGAILGFLIGSK